VTKYRHFALRIHKICEIFIEATSASILPFLLRFGWADFTRDRTLALQISMMVTGDLCDKESCAHNPILDRMFFLLENSFSYCEISIMIQER
jgi:hypothetical protein